MVRLGDYFVNSRLFVQKGLELPVPWVHGLFHSTGDPIQGSSANDDQREGQPIVGESSTPKLSSGLQSDPQPFLL